MLVFTFSKPLPTPVLTSLCFLRVFQSFILDRCNNGTTVVFYLNKDYILYLSHRVFLILHLRSVLSIENTFIICTPDRKVESFISNDSLI